MENFTKIGDIDHSFDTINDVFVSEYGDVILSDGTYTYRLSQNGLAQSAVVAYPADRVISFGRKIYLYDASENEVVRYDWDFDLQEKVVTLSTFDDWCVFPDGIVILSGTDFKLLHLGTLSMETIATGLTNPFSITYTGGYFYVLDQDDETIYRFDYNLTGYDISAEVDEDDFNPTTPTGTLTAYLSNHDGYVWIIGSNEKWRLLDGSLQTINTYSYSDQDCWSACRHVYTLRNHHLLAVDVDNQKLTVIYGFNRAANPESGDIIAFDDMIWGLASDDYIIGDTSANLSTNTIVPEPETNNSYLVKRGS